MARLLARTLCLPAFRPEQRAWEATFVTSLEKRAGANFESLARHEQNIYCSSRWAIRLAWATRTEHGIAGIIQICDREKLLANGDVEDGDDFGFERADDPDELARAIAPFLLGQQRFGVAVMPDEATLAAD